MSLPVYRWVRVSLSCPSTCLSVFSSVHASVWVCPSVGGVGSRSGGPHFLRGCWFSTCVELSISVKPCGVEQVPAPIFCGCLNCIRMSRIFLWAHWRKKSHQCKWWMKLCWQKNIFKRWPIIPHSRKKNKFKENSFNIHQFHESSSDFSTNSHLSKTCSRYIWEGTDDLICSKQYFLLSWQHYLYTLKHKLFYSFM